MKRMRHESTSGSNRNRPEPTGSVQTGDMAKSPRWPIIACETPRVIFKSIALNCETTITILGLQQEGELVEVSFSWKRPLIVRQLNGNGGCATAEGGEVPNSYEVNPASMLVWPVRIQVRY